MGGNRNQGISPSGFMDTLTPQISILTPIGDIIQWFPECLASIQQQTFKHWEWIWVGDGVSEATQKKLLELSTQDYRIKVYFQPKVGIAKALNCGLRFCNSHYIARVDADDVYPQDRLLLQYNFLENNPEVGLVSGSVESISHRADSRGYNRYIDWMNGIKISSEIIVNQFIESPIAHPSVMFRKTIVELFGDYPEEGVPEDYALWLKWLSKGVRMEKIPEVVLFWRDHSDRASLQEVRYSPQAFDRVRIPTLAEWLKEKKITHLWIWGAGKNGKQKTKELVKLGIQFDAWLEVDPKKIGTYILSKPVYDWNISIPDSVFILSWVNMATAREQISTYLESQGLKAGERYLLAG